jgi:phospholipid-binding lipoprotein MlaA
VASSSAQALHHLSSGCRVILLTVSISCLMACATPKTAEKSAQDPLEAVNRPIFAMNRALDKTIVKPLAIGYKFVVPKPVRAGVTNFFANIDDVTIAINKALQGEGQNAMRVTGRFLMNSTLGLAGTFDVATRAGLTKQRADFGMTLAKWGVGDTPYVVLPLFGPATVRDGFGMLADFLMSPYPYIPQDVGYYIFAVDLLNMRANLFQSEFYFDFAAQDPYTFLRDLYLQRRESQINQMLGIAETPTPSSSWGDENLDDWKGTNK